MIEKGNSVQDIKDLSPLEALKKTITEIDGGDGFLERMTRTQEETLTAEQELELLEQELEILRIQQEDARIQMEQNEALMRDLEDRKKDANLNYRCLDAIGQKGRGEGDMDYMARVMASYPTLMDDVLPIVEMISMLPEEGVPMDESMFAGLGQQLGVEDVEKVKQKFSEFFEDGVMTKLGAVKMFAEIGNGFDDVKVTPAEIKNVQKAYEEKLGIKIMDEELLTGLARMESVVRDGQKEVVLEYLKNNPKPVEAACEPLLQKEQTPQLKDTGFKP